MAVFLASKRPKLATLVTKPLGILSTNSFHTFTPFAHIELLSLHISATFLMFHSILPPRRVAKKV